MIQRVRALALPGLVVVALMSGCGGGSSSSTTASGGSAAATSATPSAGSAAATSAPASSSAPAAGGDVQGFCDQVKKQAAVLAGSELSSLLVSGTPAARKAYFDKVSAMNQQLVDVAPADIQASLKTLRASSQQLQALLEANGYDLAKLPTDKIVAILQAPDRVAASKALTAYVATNCKIDLTKPPASS